MTRTRSPSSARYVARLTTVVVFPTPPFWLAQAMIWPNQRPAWMGLTSVNSTIFGSIFAVSASAPGRLTGALCPCPLGGDLSGPAQPLLHGMFHGELPRWRAYHRPTFVLTGHCRLAERMGYCAHAAAAFGRRGCTDAGRATLAICRGSTAFMSLLLAAVGALVAGLLELTIGSYVRVGDAQPHLVLVLGVIWTVASGLDAGLAWAFAGGLLLDILAPRPLGSSAFALLVALSLAATAARPLHRLRPLAPVALVPALSLVYSVLLLVTFGALRSPIPAPDPMATLVPGIVYDAVIAVLLGPLVVSIHDRAGDQERVTW